MPMPFDPSKYDVADVIQFSPGYGALLRRDGFDLVLTVLREHRDPVEIATEDPEALRRLARVALALAEGYAAQRRWVGEVLGRPDADDVRRCANPDEDGGACLTT